MNSSKGTPREFLSDSPVVFYQIDNLVKYAEEDNYDSGCLPEGSTENTIEVGIRSDTPWGCVERLLDFLGADWSDEPELNACNEAGRVDVSFSELQDGTRPTEREVEAWMAGKLRLWHVTYAGYIRKVTEESCSIITEPERGRFRTG